MEEADGWIKIPLCEAGLERKLSTGCVCFRSFVFLRGKLTFQIGACTPPFLATAASRRPVDSSGSRSRRGWGGLSPDLPTLAPRVAPSIFAVPSLVDVGLRGSICARRGLAHAARAPKRAERLGALMSRRPAPPHRLLGWRPPARPCRQTPGGRGMLPCSPPADLRGDTGHPTVAGRASWLRQRV